MIITCPVLSTAPSWHGRPRDFDAGTGLKILGLDAGFFRGHWSAFFPLNTSSTVVVNVCSDPVDTFGSCTDPRIWICISS